MSTLSHTTKVAVRRALKALLTLDKAYDHYENKGFQLVEYNHGGPSTEHVIAEKAGFSSRKQLEKFAVKHRLMKDYQDEDARFDAGDTTEDYLAHF